jgi:hypothetical protein
VPANAEGALMSHNIVSNGQIVWGWRRTPGKDHVRVEARLLTRLTGAESDARRVRPNDTVATSAFPRALHTKRVKSIARVT